MNAVRAKKKRPVAKRSAARAAAKPLIGVVMGSQSDWEVMREACAMLAEFGVPYEAKVVSAHRTPDAMFGYAARARARGLRAIIAGAGGAAHLAGQDSLLSIVQMPKGIPVATFAIGQSGAANAGLFAVSLLAATDRALAARLERYRAKLRRMVAKMRLADAP